MSLHEIYRGCVVGHSIFHLYKPPICWSQGCVWRAGGVTLHVLEVRLSCTNHGLLLLLAGVDAVGGGGGPRRASSPMY